jgi:hypothetical protein
MLIRLVVFTASAAFSGVATSALVLNMDKELGRVSSDGLARNPVERLYWRRAQPRVRVLRRQPALTVGPIIGGLITNLVGWKWVFRVNLPASRSRATLMRDSLGPPRYRHI